jgi:hypothetical protein
MSFGQLGSVHGFFDGLGWMIVDRTIQQVRVRVIRAA